MGTDFRPPPADVAPQQMFEQVSYEPFSPKVARVRGLRLVTRSGLVLPALRAPRTIYSHLWVITRVVAITVASLLRRGVKRLSEGDYALIHSIWTGGYYHWLTEALPRALAVRHEFPRAVPILPQDIYGKYAESLKALGFNNLAWFPHGKNVLVDSPIVSECPSHFRTTDPGLLREVRQQILTYYAQEKSNNDPRIVYVSRSKARGRRVLNEAAVIHMLREFNADVVWFEDFDFGSQVRLLANCKLLISIHGAGLTNMLWMPRGGTIIELLPRRNGMWDWHVVRRSYRHDASYLRLAQAVGLQHWALLCQPDTGRFGGTWNANLVVNVAELHSLIKAVVEQ